MHCKHHQLTTNQRYKVNQLPMAWEIPNVLPIILKWKTRVSSMQLKFVVAIVE